MRYGNDVLYFFHCLGNFQNTFVMLLSLCLIKLVVVVVVVVVVVIVVDVAF